MRAPVLEASGAGSVVEAVRLEELRVRYAAYRRRQASELVYLLPREAVRPLYRAAAEHARARGREIGQDPLGVLIAYCEDLLPLPPFELWKEDLDANPAAHLADLASAGAGPTAEAPSTLDVRPLVHAGRRWSARLRGFRDGEFWRGYIAFEEEGRGGIHRTGTVFCERDPLALRERFTEFDPQALAAFLRSSLP